MDDYYKILGVPENASSGDIKKAYRVASLKHHPDRGGDSDIFKNINTAYQTVGDARKRQMYDMQKQNPFMGGMQGMQGMQGMGNPEDLFKMFFGGGNGGETPFGFPGARVQVFHNGRPVNMDNRRKPAPITKTVHISLEQAYAGINIPVEIERWYNEKDGKRIEKERLYVQIPPGADNNEIIVLEGKGNFINESLIGDVKIFIIVKNDTIFVRDGLDLIYKKNISLKEALVGFTFDVKHLSGKTYTINNNNGKIITDEYTKIIQHMGMRRERGHPAPVMIGNLIITFDVKFPTNLTDEQREKINTIL